MPTLLPPLLYSYPQQSISAAEEVPARYVGTGSPEGVVAAAKGSLYLDVVAGSLYVKTIDGGLTGWLTGAASLLAANNLSDLTSLATARANLFPSGAPIVFVGSNGALFAAGSAAANSWPKLTAGTVLTTPEAGALEYDGNVMYGSPQASLRGYIPMVQFVRVATVRSLPNDTNLNAIFDSPANGRITLPVGTYLFDALISVANMSATSGNALLNWLGGGDATITNWLWHLVGADVVIAGQGTGTTSIFTTQASGASAVVAGTATAMHVRAHGTFEVTAPGTLIPSIDLVTANAALVSAGSYFRCYPIGAVGVVSVGPWT